MQKKLKRMLVCVLAVVMVLCAVPMSGDVFTAGAVNIPSDAVEFNGHHYKAYDGPLSWRDAKTYCESLGGHLVTITSKEENDFILNLIKETNYTVYLIGFTDEKEEGNWTWVTGEAVTYTNWGINTDGHSQPDNWYEPDGQNYGAIVSRYTYGMGAEGTWDDTFSDSSNGDYCSNGSFSFICEWEPSRYIWSFKHRDVAGAIPDSIYGTMFGYFSGGMIKDTLTGENGVCYGMASASALLEKSYLNISDFYDIQNNPAKAATKLSDIATDSVNYEIVMNAKELIQYAFLTQCKSQIIKQKVVNTGNLSGLVSAVNSFASGSGEPVIIHISDKVNGEEYVHALLAIDCTVPSDPKSDARITVYDPNYKVYKTLTLHRTLGTVFDGWSYDFSDSVHMGQTIINTGLSYTTPCSLIKSIVQSAKYKDPVVDNSEILLQSQNRTFTHDSGRLFELDNAFAEDSVDSKSNYLFWVEGEDDLVLSDLSADTYIMAVSDKQIKFSVAEKAKVTINLSEGFEDLITVSDNVNEKLMLEYSALNTDKEIITLTFNGTASSDTVTATQTETGLVVTGISDGTVTLSKDDEVIETQTITNSVSDVEITYDKTGESDDVSLDYETPHEHSYTSEVIAPTCTEDGKTVYTCSCGDTYTDSVITALGHSFTTYVSDDNATCTKDGTKTAKCDRCDIKNTVTDIGSKAAHTIIIDNPVEPSCTETGLTEGQHCSVCGEVLVSQEPIPATGHTDKDSDGKCDTCGETLDAAKNCTHLCHKTGFAGFIWKIVNIFNKLFRINPVCECGMKHY